MGAELFFEKTVLPNGIRVITESIPHVRSVSLGFWVGVGSRDEQEARSGISHFLEHMLFKGTKTRSAREISRTFDRLGGELNAFTAKEYTCFYARVLDEHVPVAVEVLADMLQEPALRTKDVTSEREVVLEEISLHEDSPDERIHDLMAAELWGIHPLGRSILGHGGTIRALSAAAAREFYSERYRPRNLVVAAAGNIAHKKVVGLVRKFLRGEGDYAPRQTYVPEVERHAAVFNKRTEQAHICYGTQVFDARHPDRFALAIMDNVLGGGMSSRLFQQVREKRGLVYSIFSYHSLYSETGLMAIYAGTRPSNAEEVIKIVQGELGKVAGRGVTKEELRRAKDHFKGQLVLGLESTNNRMTRLGKSELGGVELLTLDELVQRVEAVSMADVKTLAQQFLTPERMVLAVIGPFEVDALTHLVA